ncbi:large conductance mechanosensitive channel protein MscL [Enterococcus sp. AZ109]|uniref:large conductance mechanosensitive channel protein MscL n=1 Tax=Enterococcus sp. AZ109 TaxID=2774634 RepID=UPI003F2908C3
MFKEFKDFLMRGNVIDLAVGVVIGSAFTAIVNKVVEGLITPLVGLVVSLFTRGQNLEDAVSVLDWSPVKGVKFAFGDVVSAIITFLITGFVLFLIVKAANRAKSLGVKEEEPEETAAPTAEDYLADIRDLLAQQKHLQENQKNETTAMEPEKHTDL